jgi:hypothetical protein
MGDAERDRLAHNQGDRPRCADPLRTPSYPRCCVLGIDQRVEIGHAHGTVSFRFSTNGNRRSLRYATPDFLSRLVVLANFMRLSLRKGAHAVLPGAA